MADFPRLRHPSHQRATVGTRKGAHIFFVQSLDFLKLPPYVCRVISTSSYLKVRCFGRSRRGLMGLKARAVFGAVWPNGMAHSIRVQLAVRFRPLPQVFNELHMAPRKDGDGGVKAAKRMCGLMAECPPFGGSGAGSIPAASTKTRSFIFSHYFSENSAQLRAPIQENFRIYRCFIFFTTHQKMPLRGLKSKKSFVFS